MKKRHIIFLLLIVTGLISIIFSITYALTTSVSESDTSDYDLSYTFTITDDTWTVTVEPSKTKVYEIALTNPYSDSIRYGVAYKINNSDISLEDISISTTKDSESLPEDLIGSNELKTVSVMIENNSTSSIEVNLIIVNGYKNGGDLIIPEGYSLVEIPASLQTLTLLGLTSNGVKDSFAEVATTDEGVFESVDDLGTSYYFRGAVENNYVYFAGFYWRIIRINGDGSIRMIYDGTEAHANGKSSADRYMTVSYYNQSEGNDQLGYMYGNYAASTYEETHENINDSIIKTYLDNWYETNIKDTVNVEYVVDAIYCNDRSIDQNAGSLNGWSGYTTLGYGENETVYSATARVGYNISNPTPSLKCSQDNDKFTVSSPLGNGALECPIGLITVDEVVMAGGLNYKDDESANNSSYYLYTGVRYFTMSPSIFENGIHAMLFFVNNENINSIPVYLDGTVRAAISISPSTIKYGNGTSTNPFRLTEEI